MANTVKNLNSKHLNNELAKKAMEDFHNLAKYFADVVVNLSGEERRRYGRVSEQNKLLINKVYDFYSNHPELSSPDVDWEEFQSDYQSRINLETFITSLQNLIDGLNNAKILFDYDNYQAALDDYAHTMYKARTSTPGFENKLREIKQFFSRPTKKNGNTQTE